MQEKPDLGAEFTDPQNNRHTVDTHDANIEKEQLVYELISWYDNPSREGLRQTPKRYVKFLDEFLSPPDFKFTTFQAEGYENLIIIKDIRFYSLCEHHMLPFYGVAHIGYIPDGCIAGLSKFARVVEHFSRRLQNQERLTQDIGNFLVEKLKPRGLAVSMTAEHFCMSMRGVNRPEANTTTYFFYKELMFDATLRAEFERKTANG